MPRHSLRYLTLIALLLLGLAGSRVIGRFGARSGPDIHPDGNVRYTVDLDTWQATDRQRTIASPYDFHLGPTLRALPQTLGRWLGHDIEERNQEVFLYLQPEQYVKRLYELKDDPQGRYVWLFLIGSRQLRSFHHPDICYSAIEWQTEVTSQAVTLPSGDLYALRIAAHNERERQMSLYFFIYPDDSRDPQKGIVMLRVASPVWDTPEATLALQQDFLRQMFE
jgi:hypothetical protein